MKRSLESILFKGITYILAKKINCSNVTENNMKIVCFEERKFIFVQCTCIYAFDEELCLQNSSCLRQSGCIREQQSFFKEFKLECLRG